MKFSAIAKFVFPNSLTLARLALGFCFFWVPPGWRLGVVAFAGFTDLVDGWFSRRLHATSLAGQILDPIADKVFILAVVFTMLVDGRMRVWELLLVAQREIIVIGILVTILAIEHHKVKEMPPRLLGKCATAAQFLYLLGLLYFETAPTALLVLAAVISGLAGLDYFYAFIVKYRAHRAVGESD